MYFSGEAKSVIRQSVALAKMYGHSYVGSVHLLLGLLEDDRTGRLLIYKGVDPGMVRDLVRVVCGAGTPGLPLPQGFTRQAKSIIRQSAREAKFQTQSRVYQEHILLALLRARKSVAWEILSMCAQTPERLFSYVAEHVEQVPADPAKRKKEAVNLKLLEQFSEDLVQKAGAMEPVIGREQEIETVIGILCRKNKNNPALIGEPGVGKTAIVEGLAQRLAVGAVPPQLKDKKLVSLNMSNLVAGTKYRGEFEERLRDVLAEIRRAQDVILFIDEMHTLVGAGAAEGAIDAANIFKPPLGRGEIQLIGATTLEEYRKYIEKDPALERRFRPVRVEEPDREGALAILRGLRPGLERHHRVPITDEALEAAVTLSCRYLPERFLPDKAIDLIDEAAAHAVMEQQGNAKTAAQRELESQLREAIRQSRYETAAQLRDRMGQLTAKAELRRTRGVTDNDVAWAVSARTGIPTGRLTADRRQQLLRLETLLEKYVMGQTEAVAAVADAVRQGLSGLGDGKRPVACLLFSGPTGVGKTELCRALSRELYGSRDAMIRLDMTEYMEKQSVSRLIGAPPGYVGYEVGGKLTEAVRRRPYCLVLLDELEKAHPDVCGLLLQIMEEGELTDSSGRKVSFRNALIVMTSNLGGQVRSEGVGFRPEGKDGQIKKALEQHFAPEFLGRLDRVVCFRKLSGETMVEIAEKYLRQLCRRMEEMGYRLVLPQKLSESLVCAGNQWGARELRRQVRERIEAPLAKYLLRSGKGKGTVHCRLEGEEMVFSS